MRSIPFRLQSGAAALALAAASSLAFAADPMTSATGGQLDKSDRTFVEKATIGGMTEVAAGKLAQDKATDPSVKAFAARMVSDHTKAGAELTKVAASEGVTVPGAIDKSHQKDIDDLAKKSGKDFDKAYVKAMVSDHKDTVSLFEKQAKSGKDANLKQFASTTLPTLQDHLQMIEAIEKKL